MKVRERPDSDAAQWGWAATPLNRFGIRGGVEADKTPLGDMQGSYSPEVG